MLSSTSATYVQLASTTSSCRSSPTVKAATFLVVGLSCDLHVVVRQREENTKWRAKVPSFATPMPFHRVREGRFVDTDTALPSTSQTPCGIYYRWPWYPWAKRLSEGLMNYRFLRGEFTEFPSSRPLEHPSSPVQLLVDFGIVHEQNRTDQGVFS